MLLLLMLLLVVVIRIGTRRIVWTSRSGVARFGRFQCHGREGQGRTRVVVAAVHGMMVGQGITEQGTGQQIRISLEGIGQTHGINFEHSSLLQQGVDQFGLGSGRMVQHMLMPGGPFHRLDARPGPSRPDMTPRHTDRIGHTGGSGKGQDKQGDIQGRSRRQGQGIGRRRGLNDMTCSGACCFQG